MDSPKRIVWAPQARHDLRDIWRYFFRVASQDVADTVLREVQRTAARAGQFPLIGRSRDELSPGLRSMLVHPHVVFYRVSENRVEIARVLHQRRDLTAIFARDREP